MISFQNNFPQIRLLCSKGIMKTVLIIGGSGAIGSKIIDILYQNGGYEIRILSRRNRTSEQFTSFKWNPQEGKIDTRAFENVDTIINLAGAGIADQRWTDKRKDFLIQSRIQSVTTLIPYLKQYPISNYIGTSAIGYYGDSNQDYLLSEQEKPQNEEFLSTCCIQWEQATNQLKSFIKNVAIVRVGIVFDSESGALPKIKLPLKFGSASYFGNGQQVYSWIHMEDIARLYIHVMNQGLTGVYNGVAPKPETLKTIVKTIRAHKYPISIVHPIPAFILRLLLGEMSAVVLNSTPVSCQKILKTGFAFNFPYIGETIRDLL